MAWEKLFEHKSIRQSLVISDAGENDIEISLTTTCGEENHYLTHKEVVALIEALTNWSQSKIEEEA